LLFLGEEQMQQFSVMITAPASRRSLLGVAFVGSLHIAVIYTLLVALDIMPTPPVQLSILHVRFFQKIEPKPIPTPVPNASVDRHIPTTRSQPKPVPPIIDIRDTPKVPNGTTEGRESRGAPTAERMASAALEGIPQTHTVPPYPVLAIRLAHEGAVRLKLAIDGQGNVSTAEVERSSGYQELDAAAVAWVKAHWRYRPAMQGGHAVSSTTEAVVTFRLSQIRG
jgi:protein TonB